MIHITGDTHGEIERFCEDAMPGESEWTKQDKLIICGDFGFVWYGENIDSTNLDILSQKPYQILFVDGNHENFRELYKYPQINMYGAPVHKIRNNVFHLQRGRIYSIENKSFFVFGGACSTDKEWRKEGKSWWRQEMPRRTEYERGISALLKSGKNIDYVLSHTAPKTIVEEMGYYPEDGELPLSNYLNTVWEEVEFKHWFFGHWHGDEKLNSKATVIWFDVHRID